MENRYDNNSSIFSLEFSSDMEGGLFKRSPSPNDLKFVAISDPEGYDIIQQADNFDPTEKDKNKKLYICGDIIDSTGDIGIKLFDPFGNNPKKSEDIIGQISDTVTFDINRLIAKSNNLKNINTVLNHDNIHLIFGNRDLNKLKCRWLCKLKDHDNQQIKQYNLGDIQLDFEAYINIRTAIDNVEYKKKPWQIHRMTHWYPFWNVANPGFNGKILNQKKWDDESDYGNNYFLERFNEIFGNDPQMGTMSAQNLLYTIPCEVLGSVKLTEIIMNTDVEIKDKHNNILINNKYDYLAFIVVAIFNSMCIKDDNKNITGIKNITDIKNTNSVKGWLHKLYCKGKITEVLEYKKNIYVLSHGGITKNLMEKPNSMAEMLTVLNSSDKKYEDLINIVTTIPKGGSKHGGFTKLVEKSYSDEILKLRVKDINDTYTKAYNASDIQDEKPNGNLLFLLIITTPYSCENLKKKINANLKCDIIKVNILDTDIYSPICSGIHQMRKYMFTCTNKILYQIIGHMPNGYGTTIDKFKHNKDISYLITLDISNTFTGTSVNNVNENGSLSKTIFKVENDKCSIETDIVFNNPNTKEYNNDYIFNSKINGEIKNKILYSRDYDINIRNDIKDIDKYIELTKDDISGNNTNISYHGFFTKNKNIYHVITHMYSPRDKSLLILNDTDFNHFVQNIKKSFRQKVKEGFANIKNKLKTKSLIHQHESTAGGYREKYLKYKQKYIKLKQLLESQQ
jgi:hypothetical protein